METKKVLFTKEYEVPVHTSLIKTVLEESKKLEDETKMHKANSEVGATRVQDLITDYLTNYLQDLYEDGIFNLQMMKRVTASSYDAFVEVSYSGYYSAFTLTVAPSSCSMNSWLQATLNNNGMVVCSFNNLKSLTENWDAVKSLIDKAVTNYINHYKNLKDRANKDAAANDKLYADFQI